MIRLVLTWTLALLHHVLPLSTERMATAIAAASDSPDDAAVLTVIGLYENTLDPHRGVPWGVMHHRRHTLADGARTALRIFKRGRRECGGSMLMGFSYFHSGRCDAADRYAQHETRMARRLMDGR
jgi:hypothetical protein